MLEISFITVVGQILLPLALGIRLWRVACSSRVEWFLNALSVAAYLALIAVVGIWLLVPWYLPYGFVTHGDGGGRSLGVAAVRGEILAAPCAVAGSGTDAPPVLRPGGGHLLLRRAGLGAQRLSPARRPGGPPRVPVEKRGVLRRQRRLLHTDQPAHENPVAGISFGLPGAKLRIGHRGRIDPFGRRALGIMAGDPGTIPDFRGAGLRALRGNGSTR